VAYAYVVVELETASLFVDDSKVTPEVLAHLNEAGVSVKPYTSLVFEIRRYPRYVPYPPTSIIVDPSMIK